MNDEAFPRIESLSRNPAEHVDQICDQFEAVWEAGGTPELAAYLEGVDDRRRPALFFELLAVELGRRVLREGRPDPGEYLARFPDYAELIAAAFAEVEPSVPRPRSPAGMFPVGAAHSPPGEGRLPAPNPGVGDTESQSTSPNGKATHSDVPGAAQIARLLRMGLLEPPTLAGSLARLDHYEILGEIGAGGMGLVLKTVDRGTDAKAAVKLLRPELESDSRALAQFLKEARHMRDLDHPHILKVTQVSELPGCHYYVMPYVGGGSLADRIRTGPPLDNATILRVGRDVATALAYAHGKGIIHRDLKPANVLMGEAQEVYLADFGLLRTLDNDSLLVLESSHCVGTVAYMAPAVALGQAEDTRCDIYSFGAVLREMLTGRPPYEGRSSHEILRQVTSTPPAPIRTVMPKAHPGLAKIAEWAMARELRDRYAQMADVVADLDRVAEGREPLGPTGRGERGFPWLVRWSRWVAAVGLFAAISLGAWSSFWTSRTPEIRIVEMTIEHFRPRSGKPNEPLREDPLGTVNQTPDLPMMENDSVRIHATLAKPAYAYLIAMHPNGELQCYYPESDATSPPLASKIDCPTQTEEVDYQVTRPLTDGTGLQAFVLVVADQPLPPYREWIKNLKPSLHWKPSKADADGVWLFDGSPSIKRQDPPPPPTRSDTRRSRTSAPLTFSETCKALAARPGVKAIRAWAFPVRSWKSQNGLSTSFGER
jgi:serine/threonine protein kinase